MMSMRPRGLSISSPHSTYVGQVGRQKPQCTQSPTRAASGGWCSSKAGVSGAPDPREAQADRGARGARRDGTALTEVERAARADHLGRGLVGGPRAPVGAPAVQVVPVGSRRRRAGGRAVSQSPPSRRPGDSRRSGSKRSLTRCISAKASGTGPQWSRPVAHGGAAPEHDRGAVVRRERPRAARPARRRRLGAGSAAYATPVPVEAVTSAAGRQRVEHGGQRGRLVRQAQRRGRPGRRGACRTSRGHRRPRAAAAEQRDRPPRTAPRPTRGSTRTARRAASCPPSRRPARSRTA